MPRVLLTLATLIALAVIGLSLWPAPPRISHVYFDGAPEGRAEVIAHGGGLGHAPPNTIFALERAVEMGADVLEVDVQQTSDGVLILRHDDTLDRTTDMTGLIAEMTWADLSGADAGARTVRNGTSFAGRGVSIPRLDQTFATFPDARWILEIKNDVESAARAMCATIRDSGAEARVLVGSFHDDAMRQFRNACPGVATSMSMREARVFVIAARLGLSRFVSTQAVAMQLPTAAESIDLAHPRLLAAAAARGLRMQYWTINDPAEMELLLQAGADGLITDYVDRGRAAVVKVGRAGPEPL